MRNIVKFTAASVAVAMMIGIAGCGSPNSSNGGAGLDEKQQLLVWAWEPTVSKAKQGFEKEHPNIDVKIVNAGSSNDEYSALSKQVVVLLILFSWILMQYPNLRFPVIWKNYLNMGSIPRCCPNTQKVHRAVST